MDMRVPKLWEKISPEDKLLRILSKSNQSKSLWPVSFICLTIFGLTDGWVNARIKLFFFLKWYHSISSREPMVAFHFASVLEMKFGNEVWKWDWGVHQFVSLLKFLTWMRNITFMSLKKVIDDCALGFLPPISKWGSKSGLSKLHSNWNEDLFVVTLHKLNPYLDLLNVLTFRCMPK